MSLAWHQLRKNHLPTYPTCAVCDDPEDPCVHHLRYRGKRGLSEVPGDLITLCRFHHDDLHRWIKKHRKGLIVGTIEYVAEKRYYAMLKASVL